MATNVIPIDVKVARRLGFKSYFTGSHCKQGHLARRLTSNCTCVDCSSATKRKWVDNNPERNKEIQERWKTVNPERNLQIKREWAKRNPYSLLQQSRLYSANRIKARPGWVNRQELLTYYEKRDYLNALWGTNFDVDHVIPLVHDSVCGLHVPENLQLLDHGLNILKSNSWTLNED